MTRQSNPREGPAHKPTHPPMPRQVAAALDHFGVEPIAFLTWCQQAIDRGSCQEMFEAVLDEMAKLTQRDVLAVKNAIQPTMGRVAVPKAKAGRRMPT